MIFNRHPHADSSLQIDQQNVERVTQLKYLGCYIREQLDSDKEIKCRIKTENESVLRMIKCYIWPMELRHGP